MFYAVPSTVSYWHNVSRQDLSIAIVAILFWNCLTWSSVVTHSRPLKAFHCDVCCTARSKVYFIPRIYSCVCLLRLNRRQACSPTAHSQGEAEETTCQVIERGSQWASLGLVEVPWKGPGLQGPPQPAVLLRPGAFPGQRGTVCVLALGQSGQPACLCQPPSHETGDKAGTRPDSPRSLFLITPSIPSSLWTLFLLNH